VNPVPQATTQTALDPRIREILGGVVAFRALTLVWALAVATVDIRSATLWRPELAMAVIVGMALWSAVLGIWATTGFPLIAKRAVLGLDLFLAAVVVTMDSVVYGIPHPQSFGSAWPVAAVIGMAVVVGWPAGTLAGAALGITNLVAAALTGQAGERWLGLTGSMVLMAVAGAVAGWVAARLVEAESEVAAARAREEFARTLHDGVLQTLAVIQRRSDDGALVDLAREQEWELRDYVERERPALQNDLLGSLRRVASRAERHHPVKVELIVIDQAEIGSLGVVALVGATTEAVTNAVAHGRANKVTICVDAVDGGCLVTVNDDGTGFDIRAPSCGTGLDRSVRSRVAEAGGRAEIRSWPGRGTEVTLWAP